MAVESPPGFEQESTYGAVVLRRAFGTLLQRGASIASIAGGLVGSTDMQVTAGSGMQVLVGTGEAWVPGTSSATQSGYYCRVESSTALAIAASSESNPRIDTIIAQVTDKAYAGSTQTFSVAVITGTAESGATLANKKGAGAVPASSMVLAYVLVPAKAVSVVSGDIENVATVAGPGAGTMASGIGHAYGARVVRSSPTEYEPSASRPTFVMLSAQVHAETTVLNLYVGGVLLNTKNVVASGWGGWEFPCPAGKKWKLEASVGSVEFLYSNYLEL